MFPLSPGLELDMREFERVGAGTPDGEEGDFILHLSRQAGMEMCVPSVMEL